MSRRRFKHKINIIKACFHRSRFRFRGQFWHLMFIIVTGKVLQDISSVDRKNCVNLTSMAAAIRRTNINQMGCKGLGRRGLMQLCQNAKCCIRIASGKLKLKENPEWSKSKIRKKNIAAHCPPCQWCSGPRTSPGAGKELSPFFFLLNYAKR